MEGGADALLTKPILWRCAAKLIHGSNAQLKLNVAATHWASKFPTVKD
jgi:hypothetical protein